MRVITHTDDPRLLWYVAGWMTFCLVAAGILVKDRARIGPELKRYRAYLTMPWKLAVFAPAFILVTLGGRFTDDETWDVITGGDLLVSIRLILIAGFILTAFVQWTLPWDGR